MKKLLLFLMLLAAATNGFAQSDKPRNWTQMTFAMNNGQKYDKSQARVFTAKGVPHWKEMSLNSFEYEKLNTIEKDLLNKYSDIVITRMFKCYFTFNENGDIGVNNITGEEIIPPVSGKVRQCGSFFLIGDTSDDFEDLSFFDVGNKNTSYKVAYSAGTCKGVVRYHNKGITEIIPYGKFDFISVVPGFNNPKGFYVCKRGENNELKWGFYDKKGEEVIECNYKSIFFDGKKFKGNNHYTMEELLEGYERTINIKEGIRQQRAQMWSEILNTVGNTAYNIGAGMQQAQSQSAGNTSSETGSGGSYATRYARWERLAESHYNSITNLGISVVTDDKASGTSGGSGHVLPSNYTAMKKSLREAQNEMRKIRMEAQRAGINIPQSKWETATVAY